MFQTAYSAVLRTQEARTVVASSIINSYQKRLQEICERAEKDKTYNYRIDILSFLKDCMDAWKESDILEVEIYMLETVIPLNDLFDIDSTILIDKLEETRLR